MTHVLAIDRSTSATQALSFNAAGELLAKASKDHQQIYPQPGWVEHDAEEIWQNTLAIVEQLEPPVNAHRYLRRMSPETADACYAGWKLAVQRVLL